MLQVCSCDSPRLIDPITEGQEVTSSSSSSSSSSTEVLLTLFRAAKSSVGRIALLCSSTPDFSLVCERPGPWYRRAVFIGDDLAIHRSPCSCAADGQGPMVAGVRQRRQPHPLGSIDEHEYSGYPCRSKHLLLRPCLSA